MSWYRNVTDVLRHSTDRAVAARVSRVVSVDVAKLSDVERGIAEAAQDRAALAGLESRRRVAQGDVSQAEAALVKAASTRDDEAADVATLDSWSPTRIWTGLRGSRDADLSREQAELQAAEYTVATAEQRRAAAHAELEQVETSIRALGDPEARYAAALDAKEARLVAGESGPSGELVEIARRLGTLVAERREIEEADTAGREAFTHLDAAVQLLEKARSWSTWDTFGGGGMLTDAIKYDRMDQAAVSLREADARLRKLRVELADVDLSGVPDVGVDVLLQTFDVWFDNIFSDWSVRSRIADAHAAASRARHDVQQVAGVLKGRRSETDWETEQLTNRRTEILTGE